MAVAAIKVVDFSGLPLSPNSIPKSQSYLIMIKGIWVTLLTGREKGYMAGISVLASTLSSVGSKYPLAVMATPDVPQETRVFLKGRGIVIIDIEYMELPDGTGHGTQYGRFNDTWTKLKYVVIA